MYMLRLVPALLVCFLIGGEITLFMGQAYAYCCGCNCMYGCTCPGRFDYATNKYCYYCRSTDTTTWQVNRSLDTNSTQLRHVSEFAIEPKCLREKAALRFFSSSGESFKLKATTFD
jgi:hypothetical protein